MSSKDFLKKQPSKTEKMMSEFMMYMHDVDHRMWSVASQVLAISLIQKIEPKKMAELLSGNEAKLQEYAKQVNEEIKKLEAERKPGEETAAIQEHNHS